MEQVDNKKQKTKETKTKQKQSLLHQKVLTDLVPRPHSPYVSLSPSFFSGSSNNFSVKRQSSGGGTVGLMPG
jgi:hypothetical protein